MVRVIRLLSLGLLLPIITGRAATVTEVLPLTDRIILVHFDDGHVVHSQVGQPWGQETVVVSPLNPSTSPLPNTYQVTSTNDPAFATALHPLAVHRKIKGTDFAWSNVSPYC